MLTLRSLVDQLSYDPQCRQPPESSQCPTSQRQWRKHIHGNGHHHCSHSSLFPSHFVTLCFVQHNNNKRCKGMSSNSKWIVCITFRSSQTSWINLQFLLSKSFLHIGTTLKIGEKILFQMRNGFEKIYKSLLQMLNGTRKILIRSRDGNAKLLEVSKALQRVTNRHRLLGRLLGGLLAGLLGILLYNHDSRSEYILEPTK